MTAELHFRLLGTFSLEVDGTVVRRGLEAARVQSLLAYLLLDRQAPLSRQRIAFDFWPDSSEEQARTNLRQLLHYLRRGLPGSEALIDSTSKTLRWHPEAPLSLDVALFEAALIRADKSADTASRRRYLSEAIAHYGGELLPGSYEEWLLPIRERLSQGYSDALEQLADLCQAEGDDEAAMRNVRLLLRHDPLQETGYRRLISLYARTGDRARALHVYHSCVSVLQRELGVEPGNAVQEQYRALLSAEADSSLVAAASRSEKLIGRSAAWNELLESWQAAAGGTRFVWLTGEAGIGKSHLIELFLRWSGEQGKPCAAARCYGPGPELAYAPLIEWLRSEPLQNVLKRLDGAELSEVARLLPELLSDRSDVQDPVPLTEAWQRTRLFEGLRRVFSESRQLQLLALDDAHWCDGETIAWLRHLAGQEPDQPQMVLVALRPHELGAEDPISALLLELRRRGLVTEIHLGPLSETESVQLARQSTERTAGPEVVARIYRESEGNPLFITELSRAGAAALVHPDGTLAETLPPRMQAVLQSRLAQLSVTGRSLAAVAACIGRQFTFTLLARASELGEDALVQGLDELWRRRIIREQGGGAYDFSHDKLRATAYSETSSARRAVLHRRIAEALESSDEITSESAVVAFHYERANSPALAVRHLQLAAAAAQRLFGNRVAISLLGRALGLAAELPEGDERTELELASHVALGVSLVAQLGYAAPEVIENYRSAQSLARKLEKRVDPPVLRALAIAHLVRGELEQGRKLGEELLGLADQAVDSVLHVEARYVLGVAMFWQGALLPARAHLEEALLRYEPGLQPRHLALYSQDPQVICLSRLAFLQFCLGQVEEAKSRSEQVLRLAEELGHPFSTAYASIWAALLHSVRRDPATAAVHADRAVALCREHGIGLWLQLGVVVQGWVRGEGGEIRLGLAQMREGMAELRATGAEFVRPHFLTLMAELLSRGGQVEQGLALLAEAQAAVERTGERWCEAELYRVRGELLGAGTQTILDSAAGAALDHALEIVSTQGAGTFARRVEATLAGVSFS